jgi:hypothetical protein
VSGLDPLVANSGHSGRPGVPQHRSGRSRARKPYRSQWRCCTSLLYFSVAAFERSCTKPVGSGTSPPKTQPDSAKTLPKFSRDDHDRQHEICGVVRHRLTAYPPRPHPLIRPNAPRRPVHAAHWCNPANRRRPDHKLSALTSAPGPTGSKVSGCAREAPYPRPAREPGVKTSRQVMAASSAHATRSVNHA